MEILIAIIGSSALFTFLQFMINRHDGKNEQLKSIQNDLACIKKKLHELDEKNNEQDAMNARSRILRFYDEITSGVKHSQGYWMQTLNDIDVYKKWYSGKKGVNNGYGKHASEHLPKIYDELVRKGEWANENQN